MGGDAIYAITTTSVYVSRDTGATWQVDTTGLGTLEPFAFDLDTSQNVYLAASTGIYEQNADSSVWRKIASYPGAAVAVLVGANNKIFASNFSAILASTDNGATWNTDSAGMGIRGASRFWKDRQGNVYALVAKQLWRSDGGTASWVRIDQTISSLDFEGNPYAKIIKDVTGDTILSAGTSFGAFSSTDHGTTWTPSNGNIPAGAVFGFAKTGELRKLESTDLGIFYKNHGDTAWTKTFPSSGCQGRLPLFQDNAHNLYTAVLRYDPSAYFSAAIPFVSSDTGSTWTADTAGLPKVMQGIYFTDETGGQHMANSSPPQLYSKTPGLSWHPDTLGFHPAPNNLVLLLGSDHNGYVYVSLYNYVNANGTVWKRPVGVGAWTPDSSGLNNTQIYVITGDRTGGSLVGGISGGVYRRTGSTWAALPTPSQRGVSPSSAAFVVSVDSSGAIFAGFSDYSFSSTSWHGAYYTTDLGTSWTYAGMDSIGIYGLVSYGDTTYAYTYHRGLYRLTRNGIINTVNNPKLPGSYELGQNYPNPFNPTTTFRYTLPVLSKVRLTVFNVLGQLVSTVVDRTESAGEKSVEWDASAAASGVYFYRLEATTVSKSRKDFVQVRKMVLVR